MEVILLGAGGHAKSCVACIETTAYLIVGYLDQPAMVGTSVCGYDIIGTDKDIPAQIAAGRRFLVSLGQLKSPSSRVALYERVLSAGGSFVTVVSGRASVSRTATLGAGTIVMCHAVVNADARVGRNCIINTGAIIEHDAKIGDHCHVSTGAIVNGGCSVGQGCLIGSGAVLRNGIRIGSDVVIGAGAVVVKDILEPGVYTGVPASAQKA